MNIFAEFETRVRQAVEGLLASQGREVPDLSRVTVEPPRDPAHGDRAGL